MIAKRRLSIGSAALFLIGLSAAPREARAAEPPVAYVVPELPLDKLGPEGQAACALARKQLSAAVIVPGAGGKFVDEKGRDVQIDQFKVVWYHQGDSIQQEGPLYEKYARDALRKFVSDGHGLFLSGAALAMVSLLQIEPVSPRLGGPGNDQSPAAIVPAEPDHPIFRRLGVAGSIIPLSDAGFPAFSDFHSSGGPLKGMLLGRAPGGSENPLAEYELGKGRIIVMGWRLPHYSHSPNPHRANLECLTANIANYLADSAKWQKIVVKPLPKITPPPTQPYVAAGISKERAESLRLAIADLSESSKERYPKGPELLKRLQAIQAACEALRSDKKPAADAKERLAQLDKDFEALHREALLANPLLDFDKLLLVRRSMGSPRLGLVANWQSNSSLPHTGFDNEIAVLSLIRNGSAGASPSQGGSAGASPSPVRDDGKLTTLFRPEGTRFVGDVDLHWDADRMLFSMPGKNGRWQVCEIKADGSGLRELPLITEKDVDNYDACYLPNGNVLFTSTACFTGVPCVTGSSHVSNIYLYSPLPTPLPKVSHLREGIPGDPRAKEAAAYPPEGVKPWGGKAEPSEGSGTIRRLTFEQDHDWCPTVLNNGRVLYLRWEYSDIPHYVARRLFHMNPDGTEQMEYYASNSYWPNSTFYARPVPNHPTRFVGIVSGHHDTPRMGQLVLFDIGMGRFEADGVVQRIPGRGRRVEPIIRDGLVSGTWPMFLHPWPLSDKYTIVACKPTPNSLWGIYLVDVFDNLLLLQEEPGYALLEPIPFRKTPKPPAIPDRVQPERKDGLVYMADVYGGRGLGGVPRGTVKGLRLFTYQFAYHGMGGQVNRVGLDGPWDVKRIMGTVPVEPDGSAYFRVPANLPISVQPLDADGKALQLMRSWLTAMPGEVLSCVGCHDHQNNSIPNRQTMALRHAPSEIAPWYGPTRGFSFKREVQPVLDAHCVRCHGGQGQSADGRRQSAVEKQEAAGGKQAVPDNRQPTTDNPALDDFTARPEVHPKAKDNGYNNGTKFSPSYIALRSYVRTPTMEGDMHMLMPCEVNADTTRLVQTLKRGHYGVQLEPEAWDRLITWIDLNTPYHGTWHEIIGMNRVANQRDRRRAMDKLYAGLDEDPEAIYPVSYKPPAAAVAQSADGRKQSAVEDGKSAEPKVASSKSVPDSRKPTTDNPSVPGWPFDSAEAQKRQTAAGPVAKSIDLGTGLKLELVRIPAGEFLMGDAAGGADERPLTAVKVGDFWIGKFEVTNEQFACFDPNHDSRLENGDFLQFSIQERGYPTNGPKQPVCRVSWERAMAFCRWLSEKTGERLSGSFALPTEAQWEYACRAGTATPMNWGATATDFGKLANLADYSLRFVDTFGWGLPSGAIPPWRPAIESVKDGYRVSAPVGSYAPNPWGLCDMHGNVSEWTRSAYRAYPYKDDDGRNAAIADCQLPTADLKTQSEIENRKSAITQRFVVRGGSWYDRPQFARSAYRMHYPAWQGVYDVGFRVTCQATSRLSQR